MQEIQISMREIQGKSKIQNKFQHSRLLLYVLNVWYRKNNLVLERLKM